MIPTLLLVGLLAGGFLAEQRRLRLAVVGAAVSLSWGLAVGLTAASLSTFVGGTALGALNVAVGVVVGAGIRKLFRASLDRGLRA